MKDEKLIEGMEESTKASKEETPKAEASKEEVPKEESTKASKDKAPKEEGSKENIPNEEKKQKRKIHRIKPPDKLKVIITAIVIIVAGYIGYTHNYHSSAFLGPLVYGKEKEPYTLNDWLTLVFLISCCAFSLVILDKSYNPMSSIKKKNNKKDEQDDDKQPSEEEVVSRYKDDEVKEEKKEEEKVTDEPKKEEKVTDSKVNEEEFNSLGISLDDLLSPDDGKFPIP